MKDIDYVMKITEICNEYGHKDLKNCLVCKIKRTTKNPSGSFNNARPYGRAFVYPTKKIGTPER